MCTQTNILVVDDDPHPRKTLSDILRIKGYVPTTAATGREALLKIKEKKPVVALIDLKLEDMSGLELMRQVKACCPEVECIVITGHASQASAIEAVNLGAYGYVQKPYDVEQLLVTIRRAIEKQETERALRQRNHELVRLNQINQTLNSSLDLNQVLITILEEACHLLDVSVGSVWLIDPGTDELICRQAIGHHHQNVRGWRLAPGEGIAGWVTRHGESLNVPDVQTDKRHFKEVDRHIELALRSILSVPLRVKQHVIGALQVADARADYFGPTHLTLLEMPAAMAAVAIDNAQLYEKAQQELVERKRAEEALQESEKRFRAVVETANDAIIAIDSRGNIISWNQGAEVMFGYAADETTGHPLSMIIPGRFYKAHQDGLRRVVSGEEPRIIGKTVELVGLKKDGSEFPLELSLAAWQSGQEIFCTGIIRNITGRKQTEKEILRRNRGLALLNRVIAASAAGLEPVAVLETACRELALAFNAPQAAAALLDEKKTRAVIVAGYQAEGQLPALHQTIPVEGNPLFRYLLKHKISLAVDDAQHDPRLAPIHNLMRQQGTVSLLILPLFIEEEVVGSLALGSTELRPFLPEEINLARNVADQVAGVLTRSHLDKERRQLAEQIRQSQKMEAIGQLTAGIAHDFNNLLTVINGFAELLQIELPPGSPYQEPVDRILGSGQRAASLVRQLMVFSNKQIIEPKIMNLNSVVTEIDKMLRRIIGEHIELETSLAPALWAVKIDPAQIEQIILNLAVNARDAMPGGGQLTIETNNVVLDKAHAAGHFGVQPGGYVQLTIGDTGVGMNEEVSRHIFEPFFTTKEIGQGTGLGLATVYGIIKQSGGDIWVYSKPGQGSTFNIYLPRVEHANSTEFRQDKSGNLPRGTETVLLVEDELSVRDLAAQVLCGQGYTVLEAADGQEALGLAQEYSGEIQLLLTDVVMPKMGGKTLTNRFRPIRPNTKVLFISGYTDNTISHHGAPDSGVAVLQKPFSPKILVHKVREVLDAPQPENSAQLR